ncbi:DUF2975 domain-containing protein [Actinokineospora bangkokensis]|uniref:ABC transporter n=1 Tax=Actinokineospora bangkokensis TaxID=1193682 RepID=A0A1Q9LNB4_9PSEU|nr:DUF2975 domain-containing protein [Actinokineospora bangkokensis]OLR93493.1 hypothetical protein BJP25_14395 [Actinokineospora bangkokensis]
MSIERRAVVALRVFLVVLFALLVVFQTFSLPGQFAHMAAEDPASASLRWPATAIAAFLVLCAEVVVVCTWKLLSLVRRDRIFSPEAFKWVDGILWAVLAAWVVLGGVFAVVVLGADDPGLPMLLLLLGTCLTVFGLVVLVMRALLRQATALRTDLDGVI